MQHLCPEEQGWRHFNCLWHVALETEVSVGLLLWSNLKYGDKYWMDSD